jgi:hypothetical protein
MEQLHILSRAHGRPPRRQTIELFAGGPALLSEALRACPKKMWLYRPAPDRWSIHEIILHLADSEADAYIRSRQFIVEPGSDALDHSASTWAASLGYFHQSTRDALGLISQLRKMTCQLLRFLPDPVWSHTMKLPKEGLLTLELWVEKQAGHIPHHVEQIQQNWNDWSKTHRQRKPVTRLLRAPDSDADAVLSPLA